MHTLESPKDFVHTKSLRYLCIQSQKCVVHTFYFLRISSPNPFVKSMSTVVASNVFGCPKTDNVHFNSDKKTVLLEIRFEESIAMRWVFKILDYDTIFLLPRLTNAKEVRTWNLFATL